MSADRRVPRYDDPRTEALVRLAADHVPAEEFVPVDQAGFASAVGRWLAATAAELADGMKARGHLKARCSIHVYNEGGQASVIVETEGEPALRFGSEPWSVRTATRVFAGSPETLAELIENARACVRNCDEHSSAAMAVWFDVKANEPEAVS